MRRLLIILVLYGLTTAFICSPVVSQESAGGLQGIGAESDCFQCHNSRDLAKELPNGRRISLYIDKNKWEKSAHAGQGCQICHGESPHPPETQVDTAADWESFERQLQEVCGGCHTGQLEAFNGSVHATSTNPGAPNTCTGCHNPHEAGVTTAKKQDTLQICGGCHKTSRETYFLSIHGQNLALGNENVAACFDCHGFHGVMPVSALTNTKLSGVCSRCHEGVTARTVTGWYSHTPVTGVQKLMMDAVRLFYIIIIPLTIASMIAHQVLKHRKTMERRRANEEEKQ